MAFYLHFIQAQTLGDFPQAHIVDISERQADPVDWLQRRVVEQSSAFRVLGPLAYLSLCNDVAFLQFPTPPIVGRSVFNHRKEPRRQSIRLYGGPMLMQFQERLGRYFFSKFAAAYALDRESQHDVPVVGVGPFKRPHANTVEKPGLTNSPRPPDAVHLISGAG